MTRPRTSFFKFNSVQTLLLSIKPWLWGHLAAFETTVIAWLPAQQFTDKT